MERPTSLFTQQYLWSSLTMAQPIRFTVACVDEDTCFFHPRPNRPCNPQKIELGTLEQVQMLSSTNLKPEDLPAHHFHALMERAFDYFPSYCDSKCIPEIYSVLLRLRYENGLAVLGEEIDLDLPLLAHEAFASGHAGPNIPPTTQLEALLDEHAHERDNLVEQDVTEPTIHRTTSPSPQPALNTSAHQPSMRRIVAIPRQFVLRSSALVRESFDARALVADMTFEASRQPARCVTTHQHITLQAVAPVPEFSDVPEAVDAAESVSIVDENRVRQDKGLPPLKEESKRAERRQRHRDRRTAPCDAAVFGDIQTPMGQASLKNPADQPKLSKSAKRRERKRRQQMELDATVNFALREDAKYAENDSPWDALSSIHKENTAASSMETPMGQTFLQARALALPDPQWAPETIQCWLDEVDEDAPDAYDDIPESDEEHPEQDARIAEGIASGVTRATLVEGTPEEDPFLRQYPEYAAHEEHWDALSSLHSEDEHNTDQGSHTTNEAIAKVAEVAEAPESNGEPESQEANEAFFETAALQSNTQQSVVVIIENARTSLQSPDPGRSNLLAVGSFRI